MDNNTSDPWPPLPADETPPATEPVEPVQSVRPLPPLPPLSPYVTPPSPETEAKRRPTRLWLLLSALGGAAILALALWGTDQIGNGNGPVREVVTEGTSSSASAVARKVVPSIVTVDVGVVIDETFELFGSGSGVVLTDDGLIATNHHVVNDADVYQVVFSDGRLYTAELVGSDRRTDLAVLRINATGLIPIETGATSDAEIGQTAIAIGSPLGLDGGPSVTVGVVSAFGRQVSTGPDPLDRLFGMLQTDAPITQGSSGGALVDAEGRLLGITSAIGVSSAGAEGIGFAIPVELVIRITDELIEKGTVEHAFIGVSLDTAFTENADGSQSPAGAAVTGFPLEGSAAHNAGIEEGDLITAYEDTPVRIPDDLINGIRRYRAGDEVTLSITRDGVELLVPVVLGVRPEDV